MFEASLSGLGGGVCLQHLLVRSWNRTGNLSLMPKKTFFFPLVLFMKQLLRFPNSLSSLFSDNESKDWFRSNTPCLQILICTFCCVHVSVLRYVVLLAHVSAEMMRVFTGETAICGAAEFMMCNFHICWFGLLGEYLCVWKVKENFQSLWHL